MVDLKLESERCVYDYRGESDKELRQPVTF
jgi:hypothetical protein